MSHEERIWVRHRDDAEPGWVKRRYTPEELGLTPTLTAYWQEEGDEEEEPEEATSLQEQVLILKSTMKDTLPATLSWNNHAVQIFFNPERAVEDFERKVKELWGIPRKYFCLTINGCSEEIRQSIWTVQSSVRVSIPGVGGGPPMLTRISPQKKTESNIASRMTTLSMRSKSERG
jgi:hypothetical protein